MKIVCIGGGPAGLYFALLMKQLGPAPRHHGGRAQQALRHLRLGRGVLRRHHGQHAPVGPAHRGRDPAGLQPLGRHRAQVQGPHDPQRRPRLRRHRAQEAAQHPAGALRAARREAAVRDRGRFRRRFPRRRPGHRQRRHQLQDAQQVRAGLQARHRHTAQPLHLAGHAPPVRRLHLRLREDRARLVPGAHLQVRRRHHHLHRRDARRRVEGARPGPGRHGRIHRLLREALRRRPAGPQADDQRAPPARLGLAELPARGLRAVVALQRPCPRGADGRRGAHRALRHRLGHQAGDRGRDRADAAVQGTGRHAGADPRGAAALPGAAPRRRAAPAERRLERDGMVRGRWASAMPTSCRPSSSCTRC